MTPDFNSFFSSFDSPEMDHDSPGDQAIYQFLTFEDSILYSMPPIGKAIDSNHPLDSHSTLLVRPQLQTTGNAWAVAPEIRP